MPSILDFFSTHPLVRRSIQGAGLGAAAGGFSSDDRAEGALRGGVAGAALGAASAIPATLAGSLSPEKAKVLDRLTGLRDSLSHGMIPKATAQGAVLGGSSAYAASHDQEDAAAHTGKGVLVGALLGMLGGGARQAVNRDKAIALGYPRISTSMHRQAIEDAIKRIKSVPASEFRMTDRLPAAPSAYERHIFTKNYPGGITPSQMASRGITEKDLGTPLNPIRRALKHLDKRRDDIQMRRDVGEFWSHPSAASVLKKYKDLL